MNTKIRYDLDSLELANGDFGYPITEKERYDLDSLELANGDFGYPITEKEVRKVNRMLELIENVRSRQMCPTEGDSVEFVTRSGDYFGKAHIERITGKYADICLIPETEICGYMPDTGNGILFR